MRIKLHPAYDEIKHYLSDNVVNDDYFKKCFAHFSKRSYYNTFIKFLEENSLQEDHNLYYFWTYYFDKCDYSKWQTEIEHHKKYKEYNTDLTKLQSFFSELVSDYNDIESSKASKDYLHSMVFKSNQKAVKIQSHPLMFDVLYTLSDWVNKQKPIPHASESVLSYLRNFIKSTKPLFLYLKDVHFVNRPDNELYALIANFVTTVGYDWKDKDEIVQQDYIRKCY